MYRKLLKCSTCGNALEFEYIGSRDVNRKGDIRDIIGDKEMWMSYFKCPECGSIEVEFHPVGEKPDIPDEHFKEVAVEERDSK